MSQEIMEQEKQKEGEKQPAKEKRKRFGDNWLVLYITSFLLVVVGQGIASIFIGVIYGIMMIRKNAFVKSDVWITSQLYLPFIGIWAFLLLCLAISKYDRPILKAIAKGPKGNRVPNLLIGFFMGFALNGICILIAWLNKDIQLYFDSFRPLSFVCLFVLVFIQSSAEEVVCRGFLYQRLMKRYQKPVIAIAANSLFFGILHLGNEGVTVLSVVNIILTGVLMSMAVYYMDSLWCAMAIHTAWNFTQNIIFGLPNSGNVVPYSVFKLETSTARNSLVYNVGFGVEGTLLADIVLLLACVCMYLWGRKRNEKPYDVWFVE